jgi:hypothetical protein
MASLGAQMGEDIERTLAEIQEQTARLRAGLTDLMQILQRASSARARDRAQREQDMETVRAHIEELESRATRSCRSPWRSDIK